MTKPIGTQMNFEISDELRSNLFQAAKTEGVSASHYVRDLIRKNLSTSGKSEFLQLRIDAGLKRDFEAACSGLGKSMSDVVRDVIVKFCRPNAAQIQSTAERAFGTKDFSLSDLENAIRQYKPD